MDAGQTSNTMQDEQTPTVSQHNEQDKIEHASSTTHHGNERAAALDVDAGMPALAPLPALGSSHAAIHVAPAGEAVDSVEAAQKDNSHKITAAEDVIFSNIASTAEQPAVANLYLVANSGDVERDYMTEGSGGCLDPRAEDTAHEDVSHHTIQSVTRDVGAPVLEHTAAGDQMDTESAPAELHVIPADVPDTGEETPVTDRMDIAESPFVVHMAAGAEVPLQPAFTADDLAIDSNDSDADSALGGIGLQSSTVSVRSSIYDMVEENGRTYHRYKEGKYVLPNDEFEQNRLDMQHHLFVMTLSGELHLAPLREGIQDALDLGTGTGIWAIEFATKYPSARVVGTDLSPIQPLYVPPNCTFEVDDGDDPWLFAQRFDYIHGRLLVACFANFARVAEQAFQFMKPGGYFELQDLLTFDCYDDSWEGSDLQRLMGLLMDGARKIGMDFNKAAKYKTYLAEAGFEDIHEVHFAWPSNGRWPKGGHYKNLGRWNLQNMLDGIEGISMGTLTRVHGWTREQVEVLIAGVKRDLADRSIHAYLPVRVVYGRKPLSEA